MMWICLYIWILIRSVLSADSYTVSIQRITVGGTVRLECQIRGQLGNTEQEEVEENIGHGLPLIWIKYDVEDPESHLLISHGDTLLIEDERYSLTVLRSEGIAVLSIGEATKDDSGMYQCQMPIDGDAAPTSPIEVIVEDRSENLSLSTGDKDSGSSTICFSVLVFLASFLVQNFFGGYH